MKKKRILEMVKYNNYIKKRIDIIIKDYKEYSETYSSIIIELKPVNNKYGQFINIDKFTIFTFLRYYFDFYFATFFIIFGT